MNSSRSPDAALLDNGASALAIVTDAHKHGGASGTSDPSTTGNAYKEMLESTSMSNGLFYVFVINLCIAAVGLLLFVFVNHKRLRINRHEMNLLRKYPPVEEVQQPYRMGIVVPPPVLWTTVSSFLFGDDAVLGEDAQVYLMFLRASVIFSAVVGVVSCAALFPLYYIGDLARARRDSTSWFMAITANNIEQRPILLYMQLPIWLLIAGGIACFYTYVRLAAINMAYSRREAGEQKRWQLLMRSLPLDLHGEGELAELLRRCNIHSVSSIELVFEGGMTEAKRRVCVRRIRARIDYFQRCLRELQSAAQEHQLHSTISWAWVQHDSITTDVQRLYQQLGRLDKPHMQSKHFIGCAFVLVERQNEARELTRRFCEEKGRALRKLLSNGEDRRVGDATSDAQSAAERLKNAVAEISPVASDVIWANNGISWVGRMVSQISVQTTVFVLMILFTSPVAVLWGVKQVFVDTESIIDLLNNLNRGNSSSPDRWWGEFGGVFGNITSDLFPDEKDSFSVTDILSELLPDFMLQDRLTQRLLLSYAPTFILTLVNALLPSLLRTVSVREKYKTRSELELSVMRKTIFYFTMNLIILPGFAMNTASELVRYIFMTLSKDNRRQVNWLNALPLSERLYTGDIAFFLCNYMVQLAFTTNIQWLTIPTYVFSTAWRSRLACSPLQQAEAKCAGLFDFPRHYSYVLTSLSVCLLFGTMAPLLWLFSLGFLAGMYLVDRYNIRYFYGTSHTDYRLAHSSANYVLGWCTFSMLIAALNLVIHGLHFGAAYMAALAALLLGFCMWRRVTVPLVGVMGNVGEDDHSLASRRRAPNGGLDGANTRTEKHALLGADARSPKRANGGYNSIGWHVSELDNA